MLAAKNFFRGDKANFVQTCSLSRMSNKFFQSASTKSRTEACITWLWICVLLSLPYVAVMHSVWPASGSMWLKMLPSSMALFHAAQWFSEGRIIGGLTEFPWLGAYLNSLLVWMVSHCFLLFLILLQHRKRFWIAFFSRAFKAAFYSSQKISFPACFESFYFLCEF